MAASASELMARFKDEYITAKHRIEQISKDWETLSPVVKQSLTPIRAELLRITGSPATLFFRLQREMGVSDEEAMKVWHQLYNFQD